MDLNREPETRARIACAPHSRAMRGPFEPLTGDLAFMAGGSTSPTTSGPSPDRPLVRFGWWPVSDSNGGNIRTRAHRAGDPVHSYLATKEGGFPFGIVSAQYAKDPADVRWKDDAYTRDFLAWLHQYYPGGQPSDFFTAAGYNFAQPLIYLLTQCGSDLSRENIMRQATSFHDVVLPWLLPGMTLNTSSSDHQPIKEFREIRFNGTTWEPLGESN